MTGSTPTTTLTLGSIDPYQVFRIFHEIHFFAADRGRMPDIAYMIDQCHNEKAKVEAMIQTVVMAQELYAKAALVDHDALRTAQAKEQRHRRAELLLKKAFFTDVAPALAAWRKANKLPSDPLVEHRRSGYERKAAADRNKRRKERWASRAAAVSRKVAGWGLRTPPFARGHGPTRQSHLAQSGRGACCVGRSPSLGAALPSRDHAAW